MYEKEKNKDNQKKAEQSLISVIVPVYNVEAYLDECLESIVQQTYTNLEIILVDDGSTDESGVMCDAWAMRDDRIRVIHKINGGVSSARNSGLAVAVGEYICYVDSDDYIDKNMYETLMGLIVSQQVDMAGCQHIAFCEGTFRKDYTTGMLYVTTGRQMCNRLVAEEEPKLTWAVWHYLYKKKIIKELLFEEGVYYEDVMYTIQALWNVPKVAVLDTPMYYYRTRKDSIMNSLLSEKNIKDILSYNKKMLDFFYREGTDKEIANARWRAMMAMLQYRYLCTRDMISAKRRFMDFFRSNNFGYKDVRGRGSKNIFRYIIYRYFSYLYKLYQKATTQHEG